VKIRWIFLSFLIISPTLILISFIFLLSCSSYAVWLAHGLDSISGIGRSDGLGIRVLEH